MIIIVIIIIIIVLGFGVWFALPKIKLIFSSEKNGEVEIPVVEPKEEELAETLTTMPGPEAESETLDSDHDGLTNAEERDLGTNINSLDTDQDGLFDKEEVKIYLTDPLNPDTDNDGILDGQEVKMGKDPKDPDPEARLLDLQKEIEKLK